MIRFRRLLLTFLFSQPLWTVPVSTTAQETAYMEIFREAAAAHPNFALSASYVLGDNAPVVMTAGPTSRRGSTAVADDAKWHIGSISKSFTSTLVMRWVDRGVLELDVPIGRYLPAYRDHMHPDWKSPTLRQLLSHTAGLPANAPRRIMRATSGDNPREDRRRVLSAMWGKSSGQEAGDFAYSNIGYVLAGVVVEEATGTSWEEAIRAEIARPLGLRSLGFGAPREAEAPRGHKGLSGLRRPVEPGDLFSDNPRWMGPAGTVHMSMADLARWGRIHMRACKGGQPDFLTAASCQAMQAPASDDYGLGWVLQTSEILGPVVWHNGSNTMWYAVLCLIPEKDIVLAVATNVYAADRLDRLARELSIALVQSRP